MSSSESFTSDMEYPDHIHECLKYVPIYKKNSFSCTSSDTDGIADDNKDDEDVKRILAEHGEHEIRDCSTIEFSSMYEAATAAMEKDLSFTKGVATMDYNYENWDEALKDVITIYPALGINRIVSRTLNARKLSDLTSEYGTSEINDDDQLDKNSSAGKLRKYLEGALHGQNSQDFIVAQPHCVANKNLDFSKPKMSDKTMNDSRKKVENWMWKYAKDAPNCITGNFHNK